MEKELKLAQIVLLSSVVTLVVVAGAMFAFRAQLAEYILGSLQVPADESRAVAQLTTGEKIVQTIAEVNPAVVSVIVTKDVPVYERYYENINPWGIAGGFSVPRVRESGTREQEVGGGSGFIVGNDGMIVTNRHVVADDEARYSVLLNDGTAYQAVVLARDSQLDIAILQIDEPLQSAVSFVSFGDSESLQLGETVIAIGNALAEFRNSVSVGVISGLSRSIIASDGLGGSEQLDQVIQTDAAINPGNSGGPLLNINGEVIGVNVAASRGADNIGFALPAHVVKGVVESVREYGEIVRPHLGVRYTMITAQVAERNNLPVQYGALVLRGESANEPAVIPGSPADKAGITENTIILKVDDVLLQDTDLATVLRGKSIGDLITVVLFQDGEERTVQIELEKAL